MVAIFITFFWFFFLLIYRIVCIYTYNQLSYKTLLLVFVDWDVGSGNPTVSVYVSATGFTKCVPWAGYSVYVCLFSHLKNKNNSIGLLGGYKDWMNNCMKSF